jgi:hypothetical protein
VNSLKTLKILCGKNKWEHDENIKTQSNFKITPPQRGEKLDLSGCMLTYFVVNHAKFPILLITIV